MLVNKRLLLVNFKLVMFVNSKWAGWHALLLLKICYGMEKVGN